MTRSPLLALFALISCALVATAMPYDEAAALYKRRFGQEHPAILDTGIRPLGQLPGVPPNGRFDQIAGAYISTLLAATDPCSRYPLIDEVCIPAKFY
ncbi:hypothetical protein BC828DRAFT_376277 [Blastocladiella britannica]|nr:hypothetical protein BC828DRAFT_376277 [Blastocladiella britannica]